MTKKRKVDQERAADSAPTNDPDSVEVEEEEEEEEVEAEVEAEDLASTLEPFSKEQLIDLLRSAASSDPSLLREIHRIADRDPAHRKIFVHGLGWETTTDKIRSFFSQYGEIEDCNVVVDKASGKSKGYGFLLFKHRRSAQKALKEPQKKIDSRMTACQLASAGPVNPSSQPQPQQQHHQQQQHQFNQNQETLARKIYVGNVNPEIPAAKLVSFFSKYGEIEEGPLGFDRQTGKSKGFALFIYKTVEGARKALEEPNKILDGHQLYCQKATDNNKLKTTAAGTAVAANNPPSGPAGPHGFNMGGGGAGFAPPDMSMSAASAALLGQGLLSGALPFGQGVQPNQAALAVLAAAGQNPAAFGIPPAMLASLNPALAAAMNAGTQQMAAAQSTVPPGFGMANMGYQNMQGHQGAPIGQQVPPQRPHSAMGYTPR
ncbi:hypothetical protein AAC387_Pa04g2996 [Persea americana]|eukprot:TRINITY_DN114_c0_g2_i1.p1 TRINITY_DN114_c0_g2~~TRINITY_DN114_c0_g2_i1.p1  ORF type:complete len:431 (+),score=112.91 TRINITY_DN114_c0_g2_i1:219-1511(+)